VLVLVLVGRSIRASLVLLPGEGERERLRVLEGGKKAI
jgi:hypothetical protein